MKYSLKKNAISRTDISRVSTSAKISTHNLILLFAKLCCFAQKAAVVPESNIEHMTCMQPLMTYDEMEHPMMSEVAMETEVLLSREKGVKAARMSMSDFLQRVRTSLFDTNYSTILNRI